MAVISKLAKGLFELLDMGKKSGEVVNYPDEWISQVPYELRKEVARHNEGILGSSYREGMEASPTYYHGTSNADIDLFNTDRVFVSKSNKIAENEGGFLDSSFNDIIGKDAVDKSNAKFGTSVYPLKLQGEIADSRKVKEVINSIGVGSANDARVVDRLKGEGFQGMAPSGYETVSFSPSNIRSTNAVFDPAKASSSNLLASNPAVGATAAGLGLLAMGTSDDSDAGVVSSAAKVGRGILDMSAPARKQRGNDMGFDTDTEWYHGTSDLDKIAEGGFDSSTTGKGNDQYGSGFYFSSIPQQASGYASEAAASAAGVVKANLALKNPIIVDGRKVSNFDDLPIELSRDDVRDLLDHSRALKRDLGDDDMNPMGDHFAEFWDDGPTDDMMEQLVDTYQYAGLGSIERDLFDGDATAFREGLAAATGHDGVMVDFGDGVKHAVAWRPNQVRATTAQFNPNKANRGDLVASNPAATAGALAIGNTVGQEPRGLLDIAAGRDALLSPEESAYLKSKQQFDNNFSNDAGYERGNILPFRTNQATGDSEFATPQMLKGLLEAFYDYGQIPKSGIFNPKSLEELI